MVVKNDNFKNNFRLNELLFQLRTQNKLTQREVANSCGVTEQAISQWEKGLWRPSPKHIPKLERIFNANLKDAYFYS